MKHLSQQIEPLSLPEFARIVRQAPHKIAKLKPNQIPPYVPEKLLDNLPQQQRQQLEELIFDASQLAISEQAKIIKQLGPSFNNFFSEANKREDSQAVRLFRKDIEQLANHYRSIVTEPCKDNFAAFDRVNTRLRAHSSDLQMELVHLTSLIDIAYEKKDRLNERDKAVIEDALKVLNIRQQIIHKSNDIYLNINLFAIIKEMGFLLTGIETSIDIEQEILDSISKDRKQLQGWVNNLISRYTKKSDIAELKYIITKRLEQYQTDKVLLDEDDLIRWLDIIVEASLSKSVAQQTSKQLTSSRNVLYKLLQYYCEQQETGAVQVAQNPFAQANPEDVIEFLIRSEIFILNYFRKKRNELSVWIGDAAEMRLENLRVLERNIIRELKRNLKLS